MKQRYCIIGLFLIFVCYHGSAQNRVPADSKESSQSLTVGDIVPDFLIPKIINSAKRTVKISDFRDQLLIIDFWSVACKGCIMALPHMDSLQVQFGDRIKILPVTYENEAMVSAFWKRNKFTRNLNLPSVVEDKFFETHFKHLVVPHEVWIYKGKVVAITTSDYVVASNIQKVLNGETVNFPLKNDFLVFDASKVPLFKPDTNQVDPATIIRYAAISGFMESADKGGYGMTGGSGIVRDAKRKTIRAFFLNQSIFTSFEMLSLHLEKLGSLVKPLIFGIGPNEMIWEVGDRSKYRWQKSNGIIEQDWLRKNGICFEALYPDAGQTDDQVYQSMRNDLNRLLGLNVRWEKRKEKVLVLVRTTTDNRFPAENSIPENRKISTGNLVGKLNSIEGNPYVFNEAKFDQTAWLNLNITNWKDIVAIRNAVQAYGLDLKEDEREVDKLIFSEVNGGLLVKDTAKTK